MERRVNKKVVDYICSFKTNIVNDIQSILNNTNLSDHDKQQALIGKVYNYPSMNIDKEDFAKRKRVKNTVPVFERCCAKRANGEQCTRRKKDGETFCGTHVKGTPHGHMDDIDNASTQTKVEVFVVDISGVAYYVDNNNNIYCPEDIMSNKQSPRIIAKYLLENNVYSIVS
jgi:hypothetical protein